MTTRDTWSQRGQLATSTTYRPTTISNIAITPIAMAQPPDDAKARRMLLKRRMQLENWCSLKGEGDRLREVLDKFTQDLDCIDALGEETHPDPPKLHYFTSHGAIYDAFDLADRALTYAWEVANYNVHEPQRFNGIFDLQRRLLRELSLLYDES